MAWALATAGTVACVLSQYAAGSFPEPMRALYGSLVGAFFIVYGVPILLFLALVGTDPLRHALRGLQRAVVEALGWYGGMSALTFLVTFVLLVIYAALAPEALSRLSAPNPVLAGAASDPWFWVAFSFVIGAVEELIFRGWIFGYWLRRAPGQWFAAAVGSSLLFAGVHVYYGTTYGPLYPVFFVPIFLIGFAFAAGMRAGGGNLVAIALLHGAYDASGFLTLVSAPAGAAARYGLIAVGLLVLAMQYVRRRAARPPPPMFPPPPPDIH